MPRTLLKSKGRREHGPFIPIPFSVLLSENWKKLSAKGARLLMDVCSQLHMKEGGPVNNGDLCITRSVMREKGWSSADSLYQARDELLHYGFITVTREANRNFRSDEMRNLPALYAVTFFAINRSDKHAHCTAAAPNDWKQARKKWQRPKRKLKPLSRFFPDVVPINGTMSN